MRQMRSFFCTDFAEKFDSQRGIDEKEKQEENAQIANFWQGFFDAMQESGNSFRRFQ